MKKLFLPLMAAGLTLAGAVTVPAQPADLELGRLPDGSYYVKHEVDFGLKEGVARDLSPVGAARRPVATGRLHGLHHGIREIAAGHSAAERWLKGEELPERVQKTAEKNNLGEVPRVARSLKARLHADQDAAAVVEKLRGHPDVAWASLNRVRRPTAVPNDARWDDQWGPPRVRAEDAWDVAQASTTMRVAIIDTGVDLVHPDLSSRIVYNRGFGANGNGDAKRDRRGGSSIDHGTHCAGIAAAIRNNTIGVAGITRANIMAMGCSSWNSGESEYWICCAADAINDAVANGAEVINCSFGNSSLEGSESDALDNARDNGVLVVVAAGNDGMNVDSSPSSGWNEHSWPLIVSNIQSNDTPRASSTFGSAIDLAAPGTTILSTVTTNFTAANANGTYGFMSGTSMASPAVAGGAALVQSMNPSRISGSGVKHFLYRMAEDLGAAGKDSVYGNGMMQLNPAYLRPLRDASAFVNPLQPALLEFGTYNAPFNDISSAVSAVPAGGTIVLNGGTLSPSSFNYPGAITINKACVLRAIPDRPVTLGR
jgi:subtilisin family serine protease